MFTEVGAATILGVEAHRVAVEADVSDGLPSFSIVGYVTAQVREAGDRVRTAVKNTGLSLPPKRITINLAPADIRKEGPRFDLPIAAAVLCAAGKIPEKPLKASMVLGELGLDGSVRSVSGVLSSVIMARKEGFTTCILPTDNLEEARNIDGIKLVGIGSLQELVEYCRHPKSYTPPQTGNRAACTAKSVPDFADIHGQEEVKRAAVLSAAGFHNLLMIGPPGSGKTMTASRIPGLLPDMTREESLEVTQIYSVAGQLPPQASLICHRPFRAPHHTISPQALAGGGRIPTPGEITLAHRGVLFLDEFPEFSTTSLEILRQPMENKTIVISRSAGTVTFPAEFLLLAAMNPCKCGYYPDMNRCSCSAKDISHYLQRISQPLLDRMDLCVEVPALSYDELRSAGKSTQNTAVMKAKVQSAVTIQNRRYAGEMFFYNSQIPAARLREFCEMTVEAEELLRQMFGRMGLSARGCHRLLRVARTCADLSASEKIEKEHILEACCFRNAGKKFWNQ